MRVTWHADDIWAGRRVRHKEGGSITQEYIIGYDPSMIIDQCKFCLVSLADGCIITKGETKDTMAQHLTKSLIQPQEVLVRSS